MSIEDKYEELFLRVKRLEAIVLVNDVKSSNAYAPKVTKQDLKKILEFKELWPTCQNIICRKKIKYDPSKHSSPSKWLRLKHCSKSCAAQHTMKRLVEENPGKICVCCGMPFNRSFSESLQIWEDRARCYKCSPTNNRFNSYF